MNRMMHTALRYRTNRGVTMVELLIAMVLALLLSVAIVQLFVSNRQTFNVLESTSRLQENGRFAMEFITRELRAAGYSGCLQDGTLINNVLKETIAGNTKLSPMWDFSHLVQGFEAGSSNWSPAFGAGDYTDFAFPGIENGTDVITIHTSELLPVKAFQSGSVVTGTGTEAITTHVASGLNQSDIVFVTDCDRGAIFQITNASPSTSLVHAANQGSPGNKTNELGHVYGMNSGSGPAGPAELSRLWAVSFYIRNDADGRPALWRRVYNDTPEELVKGVENLQILYGIAADPDQWGTVSYYVPADQVEAGDDWDKVAAVRIHLLLQSEDNVASSPVSYTFNGTTINPGDAAHPGDRRVRREFVTTVGLRNQIL